MFGKHHPPLKILSDLSPLWRSTSCYTCAAKKFQPPHLKDSGHSSKRLQSHGTFFRKSKYQTTFAENYFQHFVWDNFLEYSNICKCLLLRFSGRMGKIGDTRLSLVSSNGQKFENLTRDKLRSPYLRENIFLVFHFLYFFLHFSSLLVYRLSNGWKPICHPIRWPLLYPRKS